MVVDDGWVMRVFEVSEVRGGDIVWFWCLRGRWGRFV